MLRVSPVWKLLLFIVYVTVGPLPYGSHCTGVRAQTGPGGVGNSSTNGLWLRADQISQSNNGLVSTWPDRSGNGNDAAQSVAAQQPTFNSSSSSPLNGQPVVVLDGNDDRLLVADDDILDGTQGITYFAIVRPNNLNNINPYGILGKRITSSTANEWAYTWFFWEQNELNLDVVDNNNRFATATRFNNATNYLLSWTFDGTLPESQRVNIYSANATIATAPETSTSLINSNRPLVLGALNDGYRVYFGADYAEVIHYNYALSPLERNLVANYLSARYAIPLAEGDLYTQDDPTQGDFDFDVAGIGRRTAIDALLEARGSNRVGFGNAQDLDIGEYFLWGHDGGPVFFPPAGGPTNGRLARSWRVSETDGSGNAVDVGAVDLTVDFPSPAAPPANELRLVIDTDGDGDFEDETDIGGAIDQGNQTYLFAGVTGITNASRFTFRRVEPSLPIILTDFSAEALPGPRVVLHWQTQGEQDNDYFRIERSTNGRDWREAGRVAGNGTTTETTNYTYTDQEPPGGHVFYRLGQFDFDGSYHPGPLREVWVERSMALSIYPNPATEEVTLQGSSTELDAVTLYDSLGRNVTDRLRITYLGTYRRSLNMANLSRGMYRLRTATTVKLIYKR